MNRRFLSGALALAVAFLVVATSVGTVAAQQTTPPVGPCYGQGGGPGTGPGYGRGMMGTGHGMMGAGRGMMGAGQGMGFRGRLQAGVGSSQRQAIADALGVTADELYAARRAGTSVATLAQQKGVDLDTVVGAALTARRATLDDQVAAGRLTRSQADGMLTRMEARIRAQFSDAQGPGPGRGMFR